MDVAPTIEHTLLKADAQPRDVEGLCEQAVNHGFAGVCVNPIFVPLAVRAIAGRCRVVSVVGFPLGACDERTDVTQTSWLVDQGADEVDMVIPVGLALAGDLDAVTRRVGAVREAASAAVLKVILETGHFSEAQLTEVAKAALKAGPDYLKTSTGFGPRGASVRDIELMRGLDETIKLKASGGIRSLQQARQLLRAGATRLGTSSGVQIVREAAANSSDPV